VLAIHWLSQLLGARQTLIKSEGGRVRITEEPEFLAIVDQLKAEGRKPYLIPAGASDHPLGGLGYARAVTEIIDQANAAGLRFKAIVHSTSSGSTQAGLIAGLHLLGIDLPVIGIDVNGDGGRTRETVTRILLSTFERLGLVSPADTAVEVVEGHAGAGYALPTEAAREAILLLARTEGVLLDPVYEGKGMAGLLALIAGGRFMPGDDVLFLHLGGTPALHAYAPLFQSH
jgi:1-aminocyclopropane-1-carboxylate deaminase